MSYVQYATMGSPESWPALANHAVRLCYSASVAAYRSVLEERNPGQSDFEAKEAAKDAYRHAMPPLAGAANIRDFIACVGQGMLIGAIAHEDGARLLYAAQIAGNLLKRHPEKPKEPAKQG